MIMFKIDILITEKLLVQILNCLHQNFQKYYTLNRLRNKGGGGNLKKQMCFAIEHILCGTNYFKKLKIWSLLFKYYL